MASFYGVNSTKALVNSPASLVENAYIPKKYIFDQYTLTAAKAQNDVILMGAAIPAGATVVSATLSWSASLDASGGTLEVGWQASADGAVAADADGFMDAVDVAAAAGTRSMVASEGGRPGCFKTFASAVQPVLTVSHSGGLDATSGVISLLIEYI